MASPRKFSEKIALHNRRQAEETAAFEQIMKDVMVTTKDNKIPFQKRHLMTNMRILMCENYKICSSNMIQVPLEQMMTGEVIEERTETVVKTEIHEDFDGMENSKMCSSNMVQVPLDQMMTGEVIEELTETVVKEEIHEHFDGSTDELGTLMDCYDTEQYSGKLTFGTQEIGCESDGEYVMKLEQTGCDSGYECIDDKTCQNEAHTTNECRESGVYCTEEEIDIKYEDLETGLTDWICNRETLRRNTGRGGRSKKPKQAGNLRRKLGLAHKAKSEIYLCKRHEFAYATKRAGDLKTHTLVHKAKSDVDLYKCHECSYATKDVSSLKNHLVGTKII